VRLYSLAQAFVIFLLVAWSAWFAARRLLPTASRRVQSRAARWLDRPGHAPWLRRLGHVFEPVQTASGGCGSSGCSTCGACAPVARADAQPLVFHPRAKP
jgi:Family of unknown function (DUF6587)